MCKYYWDCKTTCTLKRAYCSCTSEITLWENADEKKLFCTDCGKTRVVKKYNPCAFCPFAKRYNKVEREKFYLVIL